MSRRGYPILGPLQLRLIDASITALKPVYLSLGFSGGRSWDQSGASPEASPEADPEAIPEAEPEADPEAIPGF